MERINQQYQYAHYNAGKWVDMKSDIAFEAPVSLTVNGDVWLSFMCTPNDLDALSAGFLYNEGIIDSLDEIESIYVCPGNENVDVWLTHSVDKPGDWYRTTGCSGGYTSRKFINYHDSDQFFEIKDGDELSPNQVCSLIGQLFNVQNIYRKSGGVHTSAISNGEHIYLTAEDIGRHNTLDKLAGRYLLDRVNLNKRVIITTGRISSEMMQKSARLGSIIVISRTSPSSMSIALAEEMGITLIGYTRRDRFNVYTHPERVLI